MLLRQLQNLTQIALKHFFDLDINNFAQLFITLIVFSGLAKLLISEAATALHNGMLTVKEDAANFAAMVRNAKENLISKTGNGIKEHMFRH